MLFLLGQLGDLLACVGEDRSNGSVVREELFSILIGGIALLDIEDSLAGFFRKTGESGIGIVGMTAGLIPENLSSVLSVGEFGDLFAGR